LNAARAKEEQKEKSCATKSSKNCKSFHIASYILMIDDGVLFVKYVSNLYKLIANKK